MPSNTLYKNKSLQLESPGSPGKPAVAGVPYKPGYYYTAPVTSASTTTLTKGVSGHYGLPLVWVPINPIEAGSIGHWAYTPYGFNTGAQGTSVSITSTSTTYKVVWVPEQEYVAPIPAIPRTEAQYKANYNFGWNSGANSAATYVGDVELLFSVSGGAVGVSIGLSPPISNTGYSESEIAYAWLASNGVAKVTEYGAVKSSDNAYTTDSVFKISRTGSQIDYYIDAALIYSSDASSNSFSLIADSSLYSGGDGIINASIIGGVTPVGTPTPVTGVVESSSRGTIGVSAELGAWVIGIRGSTAPTIGKASNVLEYIPQAATAFGALAPTVGAALGAIGRIVSIAGSAAPTYGVAGSVNRIRGSAAPTYGKSLGQPVPFPIVTEVGPKVFDTISFGDPWQAIQESGPAILDYISQPPAIHSYGPNTVDHIVSSYTVVTNIYEHGPKFRCAYNIVIENGPVWRVRAKR